ncbi:hypothetical protein ACLOJK_039063 [Asimina triloba]
MCWLRGVFFHTALLFLVFLLTTLTCRCLESQPNYSCTPRRCSHDGPEIRFPFGIQGPERCSYPGYEISCKDNHAVLLLPSTNKEVVVRQINYRSRTLQVHVDPKPCSAGLLFWSNLSSSSFHYDSVYTRANYTFLNCSTWRTPNFFRYRYYIAGCISDWKNEIVMVYSVLPLVYVPNTCRFMKSVEDVPDYDEIYDYVKLTWDMPRGCNGCDEAKGFRCGFKNKTHSSETICSPHPLKGCSLASFVFLVAAMVGMKLYHSWRLERRKDIENQIKVEKFLKEYKSLKPTRYSSSDLKRMTDQFKEKLGQGGYGSVYKGKLDNGFPVAVKILHKSNEDARDFVNEVATIGRIHHVNVVRLLGFCTENFKRALIYEFMPNESLEKFIFSAQSKSTSLSWEKLQDIAIGIARGIEYLHLGCDQRILHFDIKPHNILLDHNFIPKISDFGLAKLCSKGQSTVSMTAARGTMGYIAPEVLSRNFGNVSYKSDIYSFGMLLLEMVGGRKNIDVTVENTSQVYFPEWIYNRLHRGEDLGLHAASNEDSNIAKKLTTIALWCIQWYPVDRPSMKSVVQMLEGSIESLTMPPNPFVSSAPSNVEMTPVEETQAPKLEVIEEQEEGKEDYAD